MMKKAVLFFLVLLINLTLAAEPELEKITSTDAVFDTPESVNYDSSRKHLYISNINGKPTQADGNGYISTISITGKMINKKWVTGLNAPKGAAIRDNILYVTDINRVVAINIDSAEIIETYPCGTARFLNDLAIDNNGIVYISDSSPENSVIYRLMNGKIEKWLEGESINSPNGLCLDGDYLYFGNSGDKSIKKANLNTAEIEFVAEVGTGIDGLRIDHQGNFITSNWSGKTTIVTPTGEKNTLINTTDEKINAADLEYIPDQRLLYIPTFFDNRIFLYKLKY